MNKMQRIAIFASGSGSNFEAIARACQTGEIEAEATILICDRVGAGAIERAKRLGVEVMEISPKSFDTKTEYEQTIVDRLRSESIDLICLAGYMRILTDVLLDAYDGRIINVHPSLLPAFKGAKAIEQALEYGVKIFGVTIHYVSAELDSGRIIDQESFRYEGDSIEELEQIVHRVEHPLYIRAINRVLKDIK